MRKLIRTDGTEQDFDKPLTFAEIHKQIGSEILDTVNLADRVHVMCVDDLGISKNRPINQKATDLYWEKCGGPNEHFIHGDVIVVPDSDYAT